MALPSISVPEFRTTVPSTLKEITYRPFLVKEEKILYIALESGDDRDIFQAVFNILQACILTPGIDVKKFTTFDIEYLFLVIRSKSVGEEIELRLRHSDEHKGCNHIHPTVININEIAVDRTNEVSNKIMLTDDVGIILRYPDAIMATKLQNSKSKSQSTQVFELIVECIESIFDQDTVYDSSTKQELMAFIEGLNKKQFESIMSFFGGMPRLRHSIEWTCPQCGVKEVVVLEGLSSFFG